MKAIHKETKYTDYGELYDAIQLGYVEAEFGDVFNNRFLMVNAFHLIDLSFRPLPPMLLFKDTVYNTSTGETFEESYIGYLHYFDPKQPKHLHVIGRVTEPFTGA